MPDAISGKPWGFIGGSNEFPSFPGVFNFTRANNVNILAAMAAFKAGASVPQVAAFGDSTVAGFGGDPSATGWGTVRKDKTWPAHLAAELTSLGIPAQQKNIIGAAASGANFTAYISPWTRTLGGSGAAGGLASLGGITLLQITTADVGWSTIAFDGTPGNGAYVTWLQYTAAGAISFEVSFDGGATVAATIGAAGNLGNQTTFVANAGAPSNNVSFRRVSGAVHIAGVEVVDTTTPAVRIRNAGKGSTTTANWLATTSVFDLGSVYPFTGAALAIIDLTINDRASIPDPTVPVANLLTMRNALAAQNCDTWILVPPPGNNCLLTVLNDYHTAILNMCAANNITCVDLMDPLATLLDWQTAGYMFDGIHPDLDGYTYIGATRLAPLLQAVYNAA